MPKPTGQISKVITHIYGPYEDKVFFKEKFPPANRTLELRQVQLYAGHREVGFDETEFFTKPPPGSVGDRNEQVTFIGLYEVRSLEELSERGREDLEYDLREQDEQQNPRRGPSKLTLQSVYGDVNSGSKLTVRLAGERNTSVKFLADEKDPSGFLISSFKTMTRHYSIHTLHIATMMKSHLFIERNRFRALVDELIESDKGTPVKDRTIGWLMARYYREIHPRDRSQHSRRIRVLDDPELEDEIQGLPRHLRHLSEGELRHYFAVHAEWFAGHMLASSSKAVKPINIPSWLDFCCQSYHDAAAAFQDHGPTQPGYLWGVPQGQRPPAPYQPYNLARQLAKYGNDEASWAKAIVNARKIHYTKSSSPILPGLGPAAPTSVNNRIKHRRRNQFHFDPDFTDSSTPGASDSEPEPIPATNLELSIPTCSIPPSLPFGLFKRPCPHQECGFFIDLLDLSEEALRLLPEQIANVLRGKSWRSSDNAVQQGLQLLVSEHLRSSHTNGVPQIAFIKPKKAPATQSTPPITKRIKLEPESCSASEQLRRSTRKNKGTGVPR